jgi:CheY-like chemotaxis protein
VHSISPRRLKVLAAEDNPVFQSMLRAMLTKWGYDSVIARDGLEAWDILQSDNAPRLAILDWMMPGIDGIEICQRTRAAAREPYVTAPQRCVTVLLAAQSGRPEGASSVFPPRLRVEARHPRLTRLVSVPSAGFEDSRPSR